MDGNGTNMDDLVSDSDSDELITDIQAVYESRTKNINFRYSTYIITNQN